MSTTVVVIACTRAQVARCLRLFFLTFDLTSSLTETLFSSTTSTISSGMVEKMLTRLVIATGRTTRIRSDT
eukprot:Awhi_evm1s15133